MTRLTRTLAAAGAAAALVGTALVAQQASASDNAPVAAPGAGTSVDLATVNGSGCPQGTAKVAASPDGSTLTVIYSDYAVWAGGGQEGPTQRKNCFLSLDIDAPDGYTYAIKGIEYRGYAHLAEGATGLQQAEYYHQGQPQGTVVSHDFSGPYDGSLERRDTFDQLNWAPCAGDRNLNINTELRVNAGSSNSGDVSVMAMHSNEIPGTKLQLAWKSC